MEVAFDGAKTIDEIGVFTLQDNFTSPVEPNVGTTLTAYGITAFDVQYWDGFDWQSVPGGEIAGNDKVWRRTVFSPVETTKIRVLVKASLASHSRIVEIEAWGYDPGD